MSVCVRELFKAIIDEYKNKCIQCPTKLNGVKFQQNLNVPHACGALDGKQVACRPPENSGSTYFNYIGVFSIVLLGLVDACHKFLSADVGGYGHMSDAQIFNASGLKECLEDNSFGFPAANPLLNDDNANLHLRR
ncbi:uncharacterized protein LOC132738015 [Ruditapes philippinarum]|uniref:uncharacterized protein LOC132738015 n=1 Tax=Ruditapes philippinarum TaxID=129788 RepID=UPI00295A66D9|nr:uncharacterized protein LOC132738015 [Ruditapes philippinarum]